MFYDEHIDAQGCIRSHYQPVQEWFDRLTPAHLSALEQQRNESFRRQGITFTVYGNSEGTERTWPMDLYPRIIDATEWATIERGLCQRVTALNHFLDDIYSGTQAIIADGIIPQRLITSCTGFEREAMNVSVPLGARCVVAGIDLVRGADGGYQVLEDNLRNPSGISYVIENRAAMTKLMPAAFANLAVRSVNHYGRSLLRALRSIAPPACGDDPTIVVLTPGVFNSAYFEHAFLARSMGVELVEGRDLVVDDHVVAMRTTRGLERVDVIYRRIDDAFLDPVVFNPHSTLGVPGLMAAARAGTVTLANSVGNGVGDDKAVYAYVPNMIRYYLNEQPIIPNATTYLLWEHDQRTEVLNRLDELVIKPVAESGGYGIVIGPKASDAELHTARQNILKDPRNWIAQEVVNLSRLPAWDGDEFAPRHIDLRPFVLCGEQTEVIPGGLTRVAMRPGSLIVNSSQGGGSKDTWVLGTNQPATAPEASPATTPAASPATAPEASPATPTNSPSGPATMLS